MLRENLRYFKNRNKKNKMTLAIWFIFSLISGAVEAIVFHVDNKLSAKFHYKFGFDIHILFTVIRGIVALPLIYFTSYPVLSLVGFMLTFPFLHDGMYYFGRNFLDDRIYRKRWFDQSYSTSAIFSINPFWRIILFALGLGLLPFYL